MIKRDKNGRFAKKEVEKIDTEIKIGDIVKDKSQLRTGMIVDFIQTVDRTESLKVIDAVIYKSGDSVYDSVYACYDNGFIGGHSSPNMMNKKYSWKLFIGDDENIILRGYPIQEQQEQVNMFLKDYDKELSDGSFTVNGNGTIDPEYKFNDMELYSFLTNPEVSKKIIERGYQYEIETGYQYGKGCPRASLFIVKNETKERLETKEKTIKFRIGDKVYFTQNPLVFYAILCIDNNMVWLRRINKNSYRTTTLNNSFMRLYL